MTRDRLDFLLGEALAGRPLPADATAEERTEVARLLATAGAFQETASAQIEAESRAAMPVARARFDRFLAASAAAAVPAPVPTRVAPRRGFMATLFAVHRGFAAAGMAAAVGLLAVVALFASEAAFNGATTASAQVLNPGDYVQVEGVVQETIGTGDNRQVRVRSQFGEFIVAVSPTTAFATGGGEATGSNVKKGDVLLISGVVRRDRSVEAQTLAASAQPGPTPPPKIELRELKRIRPGLEGTVVFFGMAEDGVHGRVLIDARGEKLLVRIDAKSVRHLLEKSSGPVGTRVVVVTLPGAPEGLFALEVGGTSQPAPTPAGTPAGGGAPPPTRPPEPATSQATPAASRSAAPPTTAGATAPARTPAATPAGEPTLADGPQLQRVIGVIRGRQGDNIRVESVRGPITVVIRGGTRILAGESGLTLEEIKRGASLAGHGIAATGAVKDGRLIADVIVIGPQRVGD